MPRFEGGQFTAEILSSALYYVCNSVSNVNKCSGINTPNVYVNSTKTRVYTVQRTLNMDWHPCGSREHQTSKEGV